MAAEAAADAEPHHLGEYSGSSRLQRLMLSHTSFRCCPAMESRLEDTMNADLHLTDQTQTDTHTDTHRQTDNQDDRQRGSPPPHPSPTSLPPSPRFPQGFCLMRIQSVRDSQESNDRRSVDRTSSYMEEWKRWKSGKGERVERVNEWKGCIGVVE